MTEELDRSERLLHNFLQREGLSIEEVKAIVKSSRTVEKRKADVYSGGKKTRFMVLSDTHIGHKAFKPELFDRFVKEVRRRKPEFVLHPGDHVEGMSGRPGHVYELSHVGFESQVAYAADLYNQIEVPMYGIDGNHDQWYYKKNDGGAVVGKSLESRVKNFTNLGQDEGRVSLRPGVDVLMFHPGDGSSYAISYKLQKLMESFTGGEKPAMIFEGHYHKSLYFFNRNIHGFESGTICGQTPWMRGKKLPAHMGFWLIDAFHSNKGITKVRQEFFPHYD